VSGGRRLLGGLAAPGIAWRAACLVFVLGLAAAAYFLWPATWGGQVSYVMVAGTSMEPTLRAGDLVLVRRSSTYAPGDVVAYRSPAGTLVHRIVGGSEEEGFALQGDNRGTTDPYRPRGDELLGKMWLRVPSGAIPLDYLRRPVNMLVLVASLAGLLLLGAGAAQRRRRRPRSLTAEPGPSRRPSALPDGPDVGLVLAAASVLALLGLVALGSAVYGFTRPTQLPVARQVPLYQHDGRFQYLLEMQPSTLYPEGRLGPVAPPPDGNGEVSPPNPVYSRLARTLHITYHYRLQGQGPAEVTGEAAASLLISAGKDAWSKSLPLVPAQGFSGGEATLTMAVDLEQVQATIRTIEAETGYRAQSYAIVVLPAVRVRGQVAGEPVDDTFQAPFTLRLEGGQLVPERQLVRREARTVSRAAWQEQAIALPGLEVPVDTWRWVSVGAAALLLSLAVAAVAVVAARGPLAWAELVHRSLIVEVQSPPEAEGGPWLAVASLGDLARLARLAEGAVFKWRYGAGALYFVKGASATYYFSSARRPGQAGHAAAPQQQPAPFRRP